MALWTPGPEPRSLGSLVGAVGEEGAPATEGRTLRVQAVREGAHPGPGVTGLRQAGPSSALCCSGTRYAAQFPCPRGYYNPDPLAQSPDGSPAPQATTVGRRI